EDKPHQECLVILSLWLTPHTQPDINLISQPLQSCQKWLLWSNTFHRNPNNPLTQPNSSQCSTAETNPSSTQKTSIPETKRRPGNAIGSQGYSIAECGALVNSVKTFPPGFPRMGLCTGPLKQICDEKKSSDLRLGSFEDEAPHFGHSFKYHWQSRLPLSPKVTLNTMNSQVHAIAFSDTNSAEEAWELGWFQYFVIR
ncbi:hypothetical protein VP01_2223g1, partial [Puccinia sorghi]